MSGFVLDTTFKNKDFSLDRLPKGEYENCIFQGCNFSNGYLDNQNFMECTFFDCNLSSVNIAHSIFKEVSFSGCKMIGITFDACNPFLLDFNCSNCLLNFSSFHGLELKNRSFVDCKFNAVDFTKADLTGTTFDNCNLEDTVFMDTVLEKVNFKTAYNLTIDPEKNLLKGAMFSKENSLGLLKKYNINIE